MELRGKTILFVGAASGLGRALARELSRAGVRLMLASRDGEQLHALVAELRANGAEAYGEVTDTRDAQAVKQTFERFLAIGPPDGIFFNAGIASPTMLGSFRAEEVRAQFETNFFGFLHWLELFLPLARERRAGLVAATTALCAYRGIPSGEGYAASKGALGNFLEGLRLDLAPHGIDVFQVLPGLVETPMFARTNLPSLLAISAERGAELVVRAMRRGRTRIEIGPAMWWIYRILVNLPDRWYAAVFHRSLVLPRMALERMVELLPPFLCPKDGATLTFDRYASWVCARCGETLQLRSGRREVFEGPAGPAPATIPARHLSAGWKAPLSGLQAFLAARVEEASRTGRVMLVLESGSCRVDRAVLEQATAAPPLLYLGASRASLEQLGDSLHRFPLKLLVPAGLERLRFSEGAFDDVCCGGALQQAEDLPAALRRLRGWLSPAGRLSGVYLLPPTGEPGLRLAARYREKGLLRSALTETELEAAFATAGLRLEARERLGEALLFRAARS